MIVIAILAILVGLVMLYELGRLIQEVSRQTGYLDLILMELRSANHLAIESKEAPSPIPDAPSPAATPAPDPGIDPATEGVYQLTRTEGPRIGEEIDLQIDWRGSHDARQLEIIDGPYRGSAVKGFAQAQLGRWSERIGDLPG